MMSSEGVAEVVVGPVKSSEGGGGATVSLAKRGGGRGDVVMGLGVVLGFGFAVEGGSSSS